MRNIHDWIQETSNSEQQVKRKNSAPRKYRDAVLGVVVVQILPGDCYVSHNDEILSTILGSCVSVCLQDPLLRVGGMNHFLLPASEVNPVGETEKNRYGQYAMEELLETVLLCGADRLRLEAKIFGGGTMFASEQDVGQRNTRFAKEFLRDNEINIVSSDCGLGFSRKIRFSPASGNVLVKRLPSLHDAVSLVAANDSSLRDFGNSDDTKAAG